MGDNHHRALVFQAEQQVFDFGRGNRIQRRAGFVQQQNFRIHRERSRDAKPLLLPSRERKSRFMELVFYFVPERRPPQTVLHLVTQLSVRRHPVHPQAVRDVIKNRFRERVGPLKHHAHAPPQAGDIQFRHVFAVQQALPFHARVANGFADPVQRAKECGFPAAGRPDERGDAVGVHIERNIVQSLESTIVEVEVGGLQLGRVARGHIAVAGLHSPLLLRRADSGRGTHNCLPHITWEVKCLALEPRVPQC